MGGRVGARRADDVSGARRGGREGGASMCPCCLHPSTSGTTGRTSGSTGRTCLSKSRWAGRSGREEQMTRVGRAWEGHGGVAGRGGTSTRPCCLHPSHPRHCRARRTPQLHCACMKLSLWTGEWGGGGERGVLTSVFKASSKGEVHDTSVKGELQPQLRLTAALRPPMP